MRSSWPGFVDEVLATVSPLTATAFVMSFDVQRPARGEACKHLLVSPTVLMARQALLESVDLEENVSCWCERDEIEILLVPGAAATEEAMLLSFDRSLPSRRASAD